MKAYIPALCWAGAILGVAVAGVFGQIDEEAMTTLLIVLPAIAWTSLSEPVCRLTLRRI